MNLESPCSISSHSLKKAAKLSRGGVERLAKFLHLSIDETMSPRHLAKLVRWRLTRADILGDRFRR